MNRKHPFWNYLLTALLIAALMMVQITPAFAVDAYSMEPDTVETPPPATEPADTPPEDTGEGMDTTPGQSPSEAPETALKTVSDLAGLIQAIEDAEDGATIGIDKSITCPAGTTLGTPEKAITIQRTAPEGVIYIGGGDGSGTATIQNITFDGAGIEAPSCYFVGISLSATVKDCRFINCVGGALNLNFGESTVTNCTFDNNTAEMGAHLRMDSGGATVENCTFTDGTTTRKGGVIMNIMPASPGTKIIDCLITGNHGATDAGGITNSGILEIKGTKIYNNTAGPDNVEAEILNEQFGRLVLRDSYADLLKLYEPDGLIPEKWTVDTTTDNQPGPDGWTNMVFTLTFKTPEADPEPEPEPDPIPTPDPEPSPAPEPQPEPQPSRPRPSGRPDTTQEPEQEEPKVITLTNGKAVLKAPEALYWAGYVDSRGGGAEGITRADLALLMASMMDQESREEWAVETAPFDDVEPGKWYTPAIGTMFNTGIMVGCGNGVFAPDSPLTWGELITVFARFAGDGENPPPEVYTGGHWARDSINTAISLGWIEYTVDFDPGEPVSSGEMASFIQTVFQWASD